MRRRRSTSKSLPAVWWASASGMDMTGDIAGSRFAIDRNFCALGLNSKSGRPWAAFLFGPGKCAEVSLVGLALAQQVLGEIGERGPRQRGERQRAGDVDRGQPEPRGQQAVEPPFAGPQRQFGSQAMAKHLLDQAVARRHAAGDGDMRDDV